MVGQARIKYQQPYALPGTKIDRTGNTKLDKELSVLMIKEFEGRKNWESKFSEKELSCGGRAENPIDNSSS